MVQMVSYKLYQCYVLPRLLFGLETIFLLKKHLKVLNNTLRKLQALPERTSHAAFLLLLGALPLEAELDKRNLSLLYSCLKSGNTKLVLLAKRQSLFYDNEGISFSTRVKQILVKYEIPDIDSIFDMNISKEEWKSKSKTGPYAGGGGGGGEGGCERTPLAGQIISKSCSFSPETEFTSLILASKSEFP